MTGRRRIVLATCRRWPDLSQGDAPLAEELQRRGHDVAALPWNDSPLSAFTTADLVVLRSNWDFHHELAAFDDWLVGLDESEVELHNPASMVRTHNHKSYLERLSALGYSTPATLVLDDFDEAALESWMQARSLDAVVLKPAWGASGHDVALTRASELGAARSRWEADPDQRGIVAQEFVPQIRDGEFALVFFAGEFSHALHRRPGSGEFRVNSQYGGTTELAARVEPAAIDLASNVLSTLPTTPTYARVDIVGSGEAPMLMELELNEPGLGLHLAPGSAARFADALLAGEPRAV